MFTKLGLVLVLSFLALSVRLPNITQPLVEFHATRHYRSAVIARACYYHAESGIPAWQVQVADANREMQPAGEPPLMEWLACGVYLAAGREDVAFPRAIAAIAWVASAIPLFLLALRLSSVQGAFVAVALFLFLPYGIVASRNFQPDALMTLVTLWSLLLIVRMHERPTAQRRALVIVLVALATFIKPMSIFLTVPVLIGLHLAMVSRGLQPSWLALTAVLGFSMLPAFLYYGYGALFGTFAKDQLVMRFVPHLLTSSFFWSGLLEQVRRVFTLPLFAVALVGAAIAPSREGRAILISLWAGYAAFAVAFTYHMPTHDYYHWPFIAAVALGAGVVASRVETVVAARWSPSARLVMTVVLVALIAVAGTYAAWPRLTIPSADAVVARYREIGNLTEHDTKVLFLDPEYGYPLMYHGELSGDSWPTTDDLAAEALGNHPALTAQDRFARDYAAFAPRYFVVTDLGSLRAQPDLQALLKEQAVVVRQAADFHVYRLTETLSAR